MYTKQSPPPDVEFLRRLCSAADATGCRVGEGPTYVFTAGGQIGAYEWAGKPLRILYVRHESDEETSRWTIYPAGAVRDGLAPS